MIENPHASCARRTVLRTGRVLCATFLFAGLLAGHALTQSDSIIYSGDANIDGAIDAGDVQSTVSLIESGAVPQGIEGLVADANQDGTVDEEDVLFLTDILLGLAEPLPLIAIVEAPAATYFRHLEQEVTYRHFPVGAAGFYREAEEEVTFRYYPVLPAGFYREEEEELSFRYYPVLPVGFDREIDGGE